MSPIRFRPRFSFYADTEELPLEDTIDRISARMVTPYPPGIPLLVPGQIITKEIVNTLQMYRNYGVEIHGLVGGLIKVMTKEEEKRLDQRGFSIRD